MKTSGGIVRGENVPGIVLGENVPRELSGMKISGGIVQWEKLSLEEIVWGNVREINWALSGSLCRIASLYM